jgi:hypothetical protein
MLGKDCLDPKTFVHVPESMQQGEGQAQRVVARVLRSKTHGHGHAFSSVNT